MIGRTVRLIIWTIVFVTLGTTADAATPFDGEWSVLIITSTGTCDESYRFAGRITNGIISYEGGGAIAVSGRVAPSGALTATVSNGPNYGMASGRLVGNSGKGTWRGQNSIGACSGSWTAERKSPQS
jgi:hypothetical protein